MADRPGAPKRPRADLPAAAPAPANERAPQPRRFDALCAEFGFSSTRALRDWCRSRGVRYWRDGGLNWADRQEIADRITRGPAHVVTATTRPGIDAWVTSTLGGTSRG